MSLKAPDGPLTDALINASDKEVMDDIGKLIDKKLLLTLAKIIPNEPNASALVTDPDIVAQGNELKAKVASIISSHEDIISTIAKSKLDKNEDTPVF